MDGLVLVTPKQIGDTLLATPAIRAFKRSHPATSVTVCTADEGGAYQVLRHNRNIPEERHIVPLLRSFKKRYGTNNYKHFAPSGARTGSRS